MNMKELKHFKRYILDVIEDLQAIEYLLFEDSKSDLNAKISAYNQLLKQIENDIERKKLFKKKGKNIVIL